MSTSRRNIVLGAAILLAFALGGCGGAQTRVDTHMRRGQAFFDSADYDKARVEFRNVLQVQPKNADALYMLARLSEMQGNLREAAGQYKTAVDLKPGLEGARVSLAKLYVLGGVPADAKTLADAGLKIQPRSAALLAVRGLARQRLGDSAGARTDAEEALKLAPANESAVALLAGLESQAGDLPGAIALVQSAVDRPPESADLRTLLASLYVSASEPDKAAEQLRQLIKLHPALFEPRFQLALLLTHNHQLDEAQRTLEQAVMELPKDSGAKLALVDFLVAQRSAGEGQKVLRGYIERQPDNYDLRFGLARVQEQGNQTAEALATYQQIIALDKKDAHGLMARDRMAAIDVRTGKSADALKLANEVLEKNARDNDALIVRANIELQGGASADAIRDLRAVLRDQPDSAPLRRSLGRAYVANGQPQLAEDVLRATLDLAPSDSGIRIDYALLLLQSQRAEQAVAILEESVRRSPADAEARESLVKAYLAKQDLQAAHKANDDLITLQPRNAMAAYLDGIIAQRQNRLEDGEKAFRRALELSPGAIDALAGLSTLQLQRGDSVAAIANVRSVIDKEPNNAGTRNLLGELYLATRDFPAAVEQLTKAKDLMPQWWVPYRGLMGAKVALGDIVGATSVCEEGLRHIPFDPVLTQQLAALFEKQGRVDEAISLYDGLLAHNPQLDFAANDLSLLLVSYKSDSRQLDKARELTARFANSSNPALLDAYGWVHLKGGDVTSALTSLERATQLAPDSKVIRYHLGMAQLKAGQKDRAQSNLESALSGAVSFAGADQARAVLASLKSNTG
jgi:tetratricopeptide (TPR) repeat protein